MKLLITLLTLFYLVFPVVIASGFDHEHIEFSKILDEAVENDLVDYKTLKTNPLALNNYLKTLAEVTESEFKAWNEKQQLAYLINLYNAATLKLIADHYPITSIKNIGNVFKGPWKQTVVDLFGEKSTLDHVEHGILRKQYSEPRVHFALVCGALGCPPLREEAFTAVNLDRQLDEQGRVFLGNSKKNRVDHEATILYLSPIFDWFKEDFTRGGKSLGQWVSDYLPNERDRKAAAGTGLEIKFTSYDWALNAR